MLNDTVIEDAVNNDRKDKTDEMGNDTDRTNNFQPDEIISINEDLANLRLKKTSKRGVPFYEKTTLSGKLRR